VLAVALALAASACWGVADFTAGLKTRRLPVPLVLLMVQGVGCLWVLAVVVATGEPVPDATSAAASVLAGLAGAAALGALYRALAIGTMGVVAPISATGVALPVVVGVATGDRLSLVVSLGLALAVAGVLLASREQHDDAERASAGHLSILLALAAAAGFGTYFVLADQAADASVLWLLLLARLVVVPPLAVLVALRPREPVRRADAGALALAGTLDVSATGLFGLATTRGALSIVAVVGALYPVATVLLARVLLRERLQPLQVAGVAAAFAGVALIVAG
jgi:drug/metabolite transporter (DMT)-like permease